MVIKIAMWEPIVFILSDLESYFSFPHNMPRTNIWCFELCFVFWLKYFAKKCQQVDIFFHGPLEFVWIEFAWSCMSILFFSYKKAQIWGWCISRKYFKISQKCFILFYHLPTLIGGGQKSANMNDPGRNMQENGHHKILTGRVWSFRGYY